MPTIIDGTAGITFPNSTIQASAGQVLQVVNATYATQVSNNTNVYADTGLTATITPKFSTSKILVLVDQNGCGKENGNTGSRIELKLLRNSTDIVVIDLVASFTLTDTRNFIGSISCSYLDSPATTSATTYKTQFKNNVNASGVAVQTIGSTSTITLMEIAV
jgi:hypothetical protein